VNSHVDKVEESPPTGVFSDKAIIAAFQAGELIVDGFREESLHGASYDLTIARDGLILPDGQEVPPGRAGTVRERRRPVVLESGDTALFSTKELFRMPDDVAGNISVKNRLAAEGLSLLSGLFIDPGYGADERADDEAGCRLFLHVANTGRDSILLQPGSDAIARVQFLRLRGGTWEGRKPARASRWSEQRQASLGFLTDMKELKERVETTSARSEQVVLLGVVVLAVALIGAAFSTILSIVTNQKLGEELHNAWPGSSDDAIVWAVLVVGGPVAVYAIVQLLRKAIHGGLLIHRWRRRRRR
jgi:deoxycytidine triphosphate deaminase